MNEIITSLFPFRFVESTVVKCLLSDRKKKSASPCFLFSQTSFIYFLSPQKNSV